MKDYKKIIPEDDPSLTQEEKDLIAQMKEQNPNFKYTEATRKKLELSKLREEARQEAEAASGAFVEEKKDFELTEEEKKEKTRLNHQAYLMFNSEELISYSANNSDRFKYFAQVMHPEPAELNNILFKTPPKFDILLKSKSVDLSYFVPKIRLFKEYRVGEDRKKVVDIELPIYEQYKDEDFNSIYTNKDGRGGGVGIKSFKWNTIGKGLGNQYSFGAEIQLFFENISEITKIRSIDIVGGKTYETSFQDLLILKKAKSQASDGAKYNEDYYRIKALVGWHVPKNVTTDIDPEIIKEIEQSNLSLYMTLNSHEVEIADDSTVTLTIKYIAYIEALIDSPMNSNIFSSENSPYDVTIESSKKDLELKSNELKGSEDNPAPEGSRKKQLEEEIQNIEKQIENEQNKSKIENYQKILNYIYNPDPSKNYSLIKYITVNEEIFKSFMDIAARPKNMLNSEQQIQEYNAKAEKIRKNNLKTNNSSFASTSLDNISIPKNSSEVPNSEEISKKLNESLNTVNEKLQKSAQQGEIIIPYFYLGDLIESIMKDMYGKNKEFFEKDLKLLLGPLIFYDYGRLVDNISLKPPGLSISTETGSKQSLKQYSGKKIIINMADIPVSLDVFSNWFTKKIIDAGVINMTIKQFIDSIINDLVIRSVGTDTYSFAPRQKVRLVHKTKTLRSDPNMFINTGQGVPVSFSQGISTGQLTKPNKLRFNATDLKLYDNNDVVEQENEIENIMLIYSVSDQSFELLSDYDMDIKRGIRHIVYGAETGLVKNIKFARQDNPLIRSHNMRLASQEGSGNGIILREVYNANVEMYGNSLFEIGELIYVSPTLFGNSVVDTKKGLVSSIDFIKDLGIGGYFMILKINNSIEDGRFTTSLELKWNAKGDGLPNNLNDGRDTQPKNQGIKII